GNFFQLMPLQPQLQDAPLRWLQPAQDLLQMIGQGHRLFGRRFVARQPCRDAQQAVLAAKADLVLDAALVPRMAPHLGAQLVQWDPPEEPPQIAAPLEIVATLLDVGEETSVRGLDYVFGVDPALELARQVMLR